MKATGNFTNRDYFERIIAEKERRHEEMLRAGLRAVDAALSAQKELTAAAFQAAEVARTKAEEAQQSYNERTNELRGALNDQNLTLLPRAEADTRFLTLIEKIDETKRELQGLREARSEGQGHAEQLRDTRMDAKWIIGLGISVVMGVMGWIVALGMFVVPFIKK